MSCRTIEPQAVSGDVIPVATENCKSLGIVNVDWAWWGTSTECLNVMRNQVWQKGGNALLIQSTTIGIAYRCERKAL